MTAPTTKGSKPDATPSRGGNRFYRARGELPYASRWKPPWTDAAWPAWLLILATQPSPAQRCSTDRPI